jgi:hypothetical protein
MTVATTALEPYQPVAGLPARDQLSHAHGHIERLTSFAKNMLRKHTNLEKEKDEVSKKASEAEARKESIGQHLLMTGAQSATVMVLTGLVGVAEGKVLGETGHLSKWGVPLDGTIAGLGHLGGLAAFFLMDDAKVPTRLLHTAGDAGLGLWINRLTREVGVAWKHKSAASSDSKAAVNGAQGTVYHVAPPPPAHPK